jgi:basic membrane protein A and related proteins
VPVEQQWVSRIHIAAEAAKAAGEVDYTFTENVSNTDYPASCANMPNRA